MDWSTSPNSPTATASSVASPIAGAAVGGFETALQYKLNADEAKKAFERQQKLLRQEYDYNQLAQKESAANLVESAKRAGLSPVAVTGQSFSPAGASASGVSAAQVSKPELSPDKVVNAMDLMGAQVANLKAQNSNIAADTRGKEIDNARKEDADSVVNENFRSHFQAIVDKFSKLGIDVSDLENKIDEIDSGDRKYTVGALMTNELFERYRAKFNENLPSYDKAYLDTIVANLRANNEKLWTALEQKDIAEFRKLKNEVVNVYEQTQKLVTSQKLDNAQVAKLEQEIKEITQRMRQAVANDPNLALEVGDIDAFERYMLMDVYNRALDFGAGILNAKFNKAGQMQLNDQKGQQQMDLQRLKGQQNETLQEFKGQQQQELQKMKNAPTIRNFYDKDGNHTGGYREDKLSYAPDYRQPRQRFKRKRYYYG